MFGNVRAYEGCALFRETIAKHPKFREWYERMKIIVLRGYQETFIKKASSYIYLDELVSETENININNIDDNEDKAINSLILNNQSKLKKSLLKDSIKEIESNILNTNSNPDNNLHEFLIFRILTLNYLSHLIAFTYAAWMK